MALGPIYKTQGGTQLRKFGILKSVIVNDWGVHIYNQDDDSVSMKKVYTYWSHVAQKAQRAVDTEIIIETGHTGDSTLYFRDIYQNNADPFGRGILDFPEDAGPQARHELVFERTRREEGSYQHSVLKEKHNELLRQVDDLTVREKKESDASTAALDAQWDSLIAKPDRKFQIVGAAYLKRGKPEKPDKSFAIRLGINTTKKKHINVRLLERTYNNNVLVELPDHDNQKCTLTIVLGNRQNTRNEWCIQSANNTLRGWEKLEKELYPNWRSSRQETKYYLDAYKDIMDRLFGVAA